MKVYAKFLEIIAYTAAVVLLVSFLYIFKVSPLDNHLMWIYFLGIFIITYFKITKFHEVIVIAGTVFATLYLTGDAFHSFSDIQVSPRGWSAHILNCFIFGPIAVFLAFLTRKIILKIKKV